MKKAKGYKMNLFRERHIKTLISGIQTILGLLLLILEIRDYMILPTMEEINNKYGGIVDIFKYKDDCYWLIPLWILLFISGIFYWINKKAYKILSIIFIFAFLFIYIIGVQYYF